MTGPAAIASTGMQKAAARAAPEIGRLMRSCLIMVCCSLSVVAAMAMLALGFADGHLDLRLRRGGHRLAARVLASDGRGRLSLPFVGQRPGGMPVPARVGVVAALLVPAYLQHGEHAPHFDAAKRALARHHRQ